MDNAKDDASFLDIYADDAEENRNFGLKSLLTDEDIEEMERQIAECEEPRCWSFKIFGKEITVIIA